jgi:Icc-related predicted phosphoesterase
MARRIKLVFATDLHGSEICFRKALNLAESVKADAMVFGGDLTGKALVPVVAMRTGHRADFLGTTYTLETATDLEEFEKRVRFNGFYPVRLEEDEYRAMAADEDQRAAVFTREMVVAVRRWIELAEERLFGSDRVCVVLPGNDDEWEIDVALNDSTVVRNADERVLDFGDYAIVGLGASTPTPWKTTRELSEEEIARRLAMLGGQTDLPVIANVHVPPYDSTLDVAPQLTDDLKLVKRNGAPVMIPVGSTSVRSFLEERQPCLSLHGHVHESRAHTRIGRTLAVNPGSDYATGTLQAAIVIVDLKKRKVAGQQFVSG